MQRSKLVASALLAPVLLGAACRRQPKTPDVAKLIADLSSSDADTSGKASLTILGHGELAVPGLIGMLENPEPKLRARAAT